MHHHHVNIRHVPFISAKDCLKRFLPKGSTIGYNRMGAKDDHLSHKAERNEHAGQKLCIEPTILVQRLSN